MPLPPEVVHSKQPFCSVLFYVLQGRMLLPIHFGVLFSQSIKNTVCFSLNPSKKFLHKKKSSKDDKNEWVKTVCPAEHRTI
jgi:hypothetical protein